METGGTAKILIVEDVASMRQLLEHVISSISGMKVSGSAKNTFEARLELTRRRPDLVLLDEILPGESSVELLGELKEIPVLLLTGIENPTHPFPLGAIGRLFKPSFETIEQDRNRFEAAIHEALKIGRK